MNLNDWMRKFAPVAIWKNGKPTRIAQEVYPYFEFDLYAAWERARYVGAREILDEALRRYEKKISPVLRVMVDSMYDYPDCVEVIDVENVRTLRQGYERRIEEGQFIVNGKKCTELVWHRHDGYGEEAGSVELFAWR